MTCRMFGADVHLTAPAKGLTGLQEYTDELMSNQQEAYFLTNQFYNAANPQMHYQTTGPEIWQQAGHVVDYFVTGVGTGGTVTHSNLVFLHWPCCQYRVAMIYDSSLFLLCRSSSSPFHKLIALNDNK